MVRDAPEPRERAGREVTEGIPGAVYAMLGALGGAVVVGAVFVIALYRLLPTRNECALRHRSVDEDLESSRAQHSAASSALAAARTAAESAVSAERTARETALRLERDDRHQLANDVQKVILPRLIAVEAGQQDIVRRVGETHGLVGKLFDKLDELREARG